MADNTERHKTCNDILEILQSLRGDTALPIDRIKELELLVVLLEKENKAMSDLLEQKENEITLCRDALRFFGNDAVMIGPYCKKHDKPRYCCYYQ